jgi:hypothetical protein
MTIYKNGVGIVTDDMQTGKCGMADVNRTVDDNPVGPGGFYDQGSGNSVTWKEMVLLPAIL